MSYMDRKNILSEGFFASLSKLFKGSKNKFNKREKIAMRDPKVKKAYKEFEKAQKDLYSNLERLKKKYNIDVDLEK